MSSTVPAPAPVPPPAALHLVTGEEELLVERAVQGILAAVRVAEPAAELYRRRAAELTPAELAERLSPSLFAEGRVLVLEAAHEVGKELAAAVTDYVADPTEGVVLVVLHAGGARGKGLADALRKAGAEVASCERVPPWKRADFVRAEVRRAGGRITTDAAEAFVEAVGSDLRELAGAAGQLVADTGGTIDEPAVRRYHRGRAEVSGFAVADKVAAGDRDGALETLRWALAVGVAPVLVADALAGAIRTLVRVGSAGRGGDHRRLASELGMPPRRVQTAQAQLRSWRPEALAVAYAAAAEVNADVKGAAADPAYALERAVLRMCAARGG